MAKKVPKEMKLDKTLEWTVKIDELPEFILVMIGKFLPFRDKLNYRQTSKLIDRNARFFLKLSVSVTVSPTVTFYNLLEFSSDGLSAGRGFTPDDNLMSTSLSNISQSTRDCIVEATINLNKMPKYNKIQLFWTHLNQLQSLLTYPADLNLSILYHLKGIPNGRQTLADFPQFTLKRLQWTQRHADFPLDSNDAIMVLRQLLSGPHQTVQLGSVTWVELASLNDFQHRLNTSLIGLALTIPPEEFRLGGMLPTEFVATQFPRLEQLELMLMRPTDLSPLATLLSLKEFQVEFRAEQTDVTNLFRPHLFTKQLPTVENLSVNLHRLEADRLLEEEMIVDVKYFFLMLTNVKSIRLQLARLSWQNGDGKFRAIDFHVVIDGDSWVDSDESEHSDSDDESVQQ